MTKDERERKRKDLPQQKRKKEKEETAPRASRSETHLIVHLLRDPVGPLRMQSPRLGGVTQVSALDAQLQDQRQILPSKLEIG